jgi:putative tryptophan/tyrosine transport system substrate-binding protein
MRRRAFIQGVVASAASPITAHAQQQRIGHVGALRDSNASDPDGQADFAAFEDALRNLGWIVGRNVIIDYRWSGGEADRARALAKELVATTPDVVIAVGTAPLRALRNETHTIPILFARVSDPLGQGFVANLARPGGNITGFSNFELTMGGKWLEVLKEIVPQIARVAVIANPQNSPIDGYFRSIAAVSGALGVEPLKVPVHDLSDMESAMAKTADKPGGGVIALPDGWMITNRDAVIARANELRLPAIYPFRFFSTAGGLVSYGIKTTEQFRGVASYVDRILKGEKAGDLPVQAPTKFELVINLKTAKTIGLTVLPALLVRADEVIE